MAKRGRGAELNALRQKKDEKTGSTKQKSQSSVSSNKNGGGRTGGLTRQQVQQKVSRSAGYTSSGKAKQPAQTQKTNPYATTRNIVNRSNNSKAPERASRTSNRINSSNTRGREQTPIDRRQTFATAVEMREARENERLKRNPAPTAKKMLEEREKNKDSKFAETVKNTGSASKKGALDAASGHAQAALDTLSGLTSNEQRNYTWLRAAELSAGIDNKAETRKAAKGTLETSKQLDEERKKLNAEQEKRQEEFDKKTKNSSGLQKAIYGAAESGTGMATDLAIGRLTGTGQAGSLASMFSRTYGTTRGQAEKEGATENEDRLYAGLQAVKEVGTELMFPGVGLAKGFVGKGGIKAGERFANALTKNMRGKAADTVYAGLRMLGGTAEENAEELAGWGLDPFIKDIAYGRNVRARAKESLMSDLPEITSREQAEALTARLNSDSYVNELAAEFKANGLGDKEAKELATKMRDFYAAYYSGDTEKADEIGDDLAGDLTGVKKISKESFSTSELRETIEATTLLTATTGLPGAISTAQRGDQIKQGLKADGLKALAKEVMNSEDAEASERGKIAQAALESGKDITSTQAYDLEQGLYQQQEKDVKRQIALIDTASKQADENGYVAPYTIDEYGRITSMEKATRTAYNEAAESASETLDHVDTKESLTDIDKAYGARAIAGFKTGAFTVDDANTIVADETIKDAFKAETGIDLGQYEVKNRDGSINIPKTNAATKDALFAMATDNLVKMAEAETANWKDVTKGETLRQVTARMGAKGGVAAQLVLNDVDERDTMQYRTMTAVSDYVYQSALNLGVSWEDAKDSITSQFSTIPEEKLRTLYDAGLADRQAANDKMLGVQTKIGEAMSKSAARIDPTKGNLFIETEETPGSSATEVFRGIAESLGIDIYIVDDLLIKDKDGKDTGRQANGQHFKGDIYINVNSTFEENLGFIFMHEVTHHLKQYAPEQYKALEDLVREEWFKANPEEMLDRIARKIKTYEDAGQTLTEEEALEEIIADSTHEFLMDKNFAEQVSKKDSSLAKAVLSAIKNLLRKLRQVFSSGNYASSKTQMDSIFKQLGIMEEAEKLWLDAYTEAAKNKAAVGLVEWQDKVFEESKNSVGYHAGDLGKSTADDYAHQGYGRGTGHFGFGTYFVGDQAQIGQGSGYGSRPVETVDFDKYNLARPRNEEMGFKLHDALKRIDGFVQDYSEFAKYTDILNRTEEASARAFYITSRVHSDLDDITWDLYEGNEPNPERKDRVDQYVESLPQDYKDAIEEKAAEYIDRDNQRAGTTDDLGLVNERNSDEYWRYEAIADIAKEYGEDWQKEYDKFQFLVSDIRQALNYAVSETDIEEALKKTEEIVKGYQPNGGYRLDAEPGLDSGATVFMKQLGYEGVDVRHLPRLDNTGYGSVIYDLKDEDLARKQEIGTARFSISEPVERVKDLIAVHNLKPDDIRNTFELGGFPMPSIAVTKDSMGHDLYGDITLMFHSDTIDPMRSRDNQVFGGDAWTPTFPPVAKKISREVAERVDQKLRDILGPSATDYTLGDLRLPALDDDNLTNSLRYNDPYDAFKNDEVFQIAYLKNAKNFDVAVPTKEGNIRGLNKQALEFLDDRLPELTHNDIYDTVDHTMEYEPAVREARKAYYEAKGGTKLKALSKMLDEKMGYSDVLTRLEATIKFREEGVPEVTDRDALDSILKEHVDQEGFKNWIDNLFEGIVEKTGIRNDKDMFTASGNRRSWESLHDPVTLENVVKVMKTELAAGGNGLFGSNPKGAAQKNYKSLDEIRSDENRLQSLPEEEYEAQSDQAVGKLAEVSQAIAEHNPKRFDNNFGFGAALDVGSYVAEILNSTRNRSTIQRKLKEDYWLDVTDDQMDDLMEAIEAIANLPTGYFEAKPRRAVGFDEVKAAIIPASTDEDIKKGFNDRGIQMYEYDPDVEGDRTEKVNEAATQQDLRFSITDSEGNALSDGQVNFFRDSKMVDKEGRLVPMYHGTQNEFTEFDITKAYPGTLGRGFYFSASESHSGVYGKIGKYYLNLVNPLMPDTNEITKDQLKRFVAELAEDEDYGIDNYGYDATIDSVTDSVWGGTDFAMLRDINLSSVGDFAEALKIFNRVNGTDYDGIITSTETLAFYPQQIKSVDNLNPTLSKDTRYSITDSDGKDLTDGQVDYFKNSQARDSEGKMQVVYHTTNYGGFTVFDPSYSDDKRSLFFASNFDVSQTYGNKSARKPIDLNPELEPEEVEYKALTENDLMKIVNKHGDFRVFTQEEYDSYVPATEESYQGYRYKEDKAEAFERKYGENANWAGGYRFYTYLEDLKAGNIGPNDYVLTYYDRAGHVYAKGNSLEELLGNLSQREYDKAVREAEEDFRRKQEDAKAGYYTCYINLENPLIVDAEGANWNAIPYSPVTRESVLEGMKQKASIGISDISTKYTLDGDGFPTNERTVTIKGERKNSNGVWEEFEVSKTFSPDDASQTKKIVQDFFRKEVGDSDTMIHFLNRQWATTSYKTGEGSFHYNYAAKHINDDLDFGYEYFTEEGKNVYPATYYGTSTYRTRDLAEMAETQGYDGVIIRKCRDIGGASRLRNGASPISDIFIAFSSSQVKDTRNENPTENPDIRYSIPPEDETMNYAQTNAETTDNLWYTDPVMHECAIRYSMSKKDFINGTTDKWNPAWKTEGRVLKEKSVEKDIRNVIMGAMRNSDTSAKYRQKVVKETMLVARKAFDYMKSDEHTKAAALLYDHAHSIIEDLEFFENQDESEFQRYKELKEYLRTTKITVPEDKRSDIDYEAFRRNNFRKILLGDGGIAPDKVWGHLNELWPEAFSEDIKGDIPGIMLQIENALDIYKPYAEAYSSEQCEEFAGDIANSLWDIIYEGEAFKSLADKYDDKAKAMKLRHQEAMRKVKENYKEKLTKQALDAKRKQYAMLDRQKARYEEKLDQQKARLNARQGKALGKQKARYEKEISRLKENRKNADAKRRARREHRTLYDRILKEYKDLTHRLLNPSKDKTKNIPEQLRQPLAQMLYCFDLEKERSKKLEEMYMIPTRSQLNFRQLKDAMEQVVKEDPTAYEMSDIHKYLKDKMTDLADRVDGKSIDALDEADMQIVKDLLSGLNKAIKDGQQLEIDGENYQKQVQCDKVGEGAAEHQKIYGKAKTYDGARKIVDNILNMGELTPIYFFKGIPGMYDMYRQLRTGFDEYVRNENEIIDKIADILAPYYKTNRKGQRVQGSEIEDWRHAETAETFDLISGDQTITLTIAQRMALYCLAKRSHAQGHMYSENGGIVASEITAGSKITKAKESVKGKIVEQKPVVLTPADVDNIIASLTDDQVKIAEQLQDLMSKDMSVLGNKASMKLTGIEMYKEDNYFPIKVQGDSRPTDIDNIGIREKIRNPGFSNPLIENAQNPIIVDDIFTVVASHCNEMNQYASYAVPITSFMKVYNGSVLDENNKPVKIKTLIRQTYGDKAITYIENFIDDINGNSFKRQGGLDDVLDKALGQAKKAAVFANLRVALQQPTAIVRAFAALDPKYFKGVKPSPKATQEMIEHCPIAQWKAWGYYDTHFGRDIEDVMMGKNVPNKMDYFMSEIYGALDNMTWGMIWQAVKNEVKTTNKGIDENSQEFWDLCNERASYVFDTTQVVDSPFHRSNDMRSKNGLVKQLTSFQAEPTLSFNVLRQGLVDAIEASKTGNNSKARKVILKTLTVWTVQALTVALAQSFVDALRRKGKKDGDDDKDEMLTWYQEIAKYFLRNFGNNLADDMNPINNVYFFKDIVPPILNAIKGEYVFGQQNLTFQWVDSLTTGIEHCRMKWEKGDAYSKSWYDCISELLGGLGYFAGVPAKTMMRGVKNAWHWFNKVTGANVFADDGSVVDSTVESVVSRFRGSGESSGSESSGTKTGSSEGGTGEPNTTREERDKAIRKEADQIKGGVADKTGEEREKATWKKVTDFIKENEGKSVEELVASGDYDILNKYRVMYVYAGNTKDYFDQRIFDESKSAMKKSILYDPTEQQTMAQQNIKDYLTANGMSEADLSEIAYKSETKKDLAVACRIGDEDAMVESLVPLIRAGLTYEDFVKIYDNRNRVDLKKYKDKGGRYASKLKSMGTFIWPTKGVVTSHFGYRNSPTAGASSNHPAIDIGASTGTPVVAADGGVVIYAGSNGGYGNSVGIKHDNGMVTYYNHLYAWNVKVGDTVGQGQQIAQVGSTGISTGPHLDFKILDKNGKPVDPEKYLN